MLFIGFSLKAQDVDIDSLNSAIFNHINTQRVASGIEDLVLTEVMENTAQDQANYCTLVKAETNTQKELKKSTAALRVTFFGGIKDGIPQEIIFSEAVKNSRGIDYGTGELLAKLIKKLDKTSFKISNQVIKQKFHYFSTKAISMRTRNKIEDSYH